MTGPVTFHTSFLLPPGKTDVMDKLRLDRTFGVGPAKFTSKAIRQKVKELSRKGEGEAGRAVLQGQGKGQGHKPADPHRRHAPEAGFRAGPQAVTAAAGLTRRSRSRR